MKKQALCAIVMMIITVSSNILCMETESNPLTIAPNLQLDAIYKINDDIFRWKTQDTYNSISRSAQYNTLLTCIKKNDMLYFSQCLMTYKFNPNRYRKQLSLLHCAIEHDSDTAINLLALFNADLMPRNLDGQTPLDYAISLNATKSIKAMADAMQKRYLQLVTSGSHCGLVKHILKPAPCVKCPRELRRQLEHYGLWKACKNIDDVCAVLNS